MTADLIPFDWDKYKSGQYIVVDGWGEKVTSLWKFEDTDADYPVQGVLERQIKAWTVEGKYYKDEEDYDEEEDKKRDLLLRRALFSLYP